MARGGVVFDADLARAIGEALFESHYGGDELKRQLPLIVEDKEDYWRIEGSWNRDFKIDDNGPLFLSIHKYDGRVFDLGLWGQCSFAARSTNFWPPQDSCRRMIRAVCDQVE